MRLALRIPLYIFGVIAVVLIAGFYVYYFTTLPESELNSWISSLISSKGDITISVRRVNRDIWDRLMLEGVSVKPKEGSGAPTAYISKIELDYDIVTILQNKNIYRSLIIDTVLIKLPPAPAGSEEMLQQESRQFKLPINASINRIFINSIDMILPDEEDVSLNGLALSASSHDDRLDLKLDNASGRWAARDIHLHSVSGEFSYGPEGITVNDLNIATSRSAISIQGKVAHNFVDGIDISYNLNPINLVEIRNLSGVKVEGSLRASGTVNGSLERFAGKAIVNGKFFDRDFEDLNLSYSYSDKAMTFESINGKIFRSRFTGSGKLDLSTSPENYSYSGTIEHLNLINIGPAVRTDFSGHVDMNGRGLSEGSFFMNINCELDSIRIEDYYFDRAEGSFNLDLSHIEFQKGFRGRYKNTGFSFAGTMEYEGDIDISGNADFGDLTDYAGQIFLKDLGGRGTAIFHFSGLTSDFDMTGSFHSDSCRVYGLEPEEMYVNVDLKSFIGHRVGTVDGYWLGGTLYSVNTNSGFFETSISGDRVFIDTVYVGSRDGSLWMRGAYDGTTVPPVFRVDTLWTDIYGIELRSDGPLLFGIYDNEVEFSRFKLLFGSGSIGLEGTVTNDLEMALDLKAAGFQIRPALALVYRERVVEGLFSGNCKISGTFDKPILQASVDLDSIKIDNIYIGNFDIESEYADGYLVTKKSILESPYGDYEFFGRLPINLAFEGVENRFPNDPVNMQMTASGNRLVLAEVFISTIDTFRTDYSVNMAFTGSYENPLVTGEGKIDNGFLKVLELETPLTSISARVRMENEIITIVDASATVSANQTNVEEALEDLVSVLDKKKNKAIVRASGTMKLLGLTDFLYDIDVSGRNFFFKSDQFDVSGICDFNLAIDGPTPPVVRGNIVFTRLDVREEFSSFYDPEFETASAAIEDSSSWDLDLDIFAQNNIWIRNSEINAEFKSDMHVERNVGILNILGTLEAVRGSYYLVNNKFTFESGVMTFQDVARLNPDIDFLVSTKLRGAGSDASITEIELQITGTLYEPRISAASGSELSNEDVLRMLLQSNWVASAGTQNVIEGASTLVRSFALDPRIAQNVFEEIEFNAGGGEENQAGFTLAKYISPRLYLRYSQHLSADNPGRLIGVEYYLNKNFLLKASQGQQGSEYEGISVDINFNIEF